MGEHLGFDDIDDFEPADLGTVVETGADALTRLEEDLEGIDLLGELDDEALANVRENLDALEDVTTALAELIEAMDLSDLAEAVEPDELLDAIDAGEIPDALQSGDLTDAIDVTALLDALNLLKAWNATDVTNVIREGDDLTDTLEDVSEEDSLVGTATSTVTGADDDDDGKLLEAGTEMMDVDRDETMDALDVDVLKDPEYVQVSIQQAAMKAIDGVRWTLLETHEQFEKLYEFNRKRMRRQDRGTTSRNPTAASTMPVARADLGSDSRYSTVPQQVKLSTAPARRRIYGRRFEIERERQRGER